MLKVKKLFYKWKYRSEPPEMVQYWMNSLSTEAKQMKKPEGHYVLRMAGEKYEFPGYPRGSLLFGPLSPLKHVIKNRIFNESWKNLEEGMDQALIWADIRKGLDEVALIMDKGRLDLIPQQFLNPPVKELHRALSLVEKKYPRARGIKEFLCHIIQEDDSYRWRLQWLTKFFNPNSWWRKLTGRDPMKDLDFALSMLEHGEVVGDMKERQRLLRRIVMFALKDPQIKEAFLMLCSELDWKQLQLSKADKYYFRAKYFKVDYPEFEY